MGGLSIWHWIVVAAVVFVVFGGKFKISDVMGDVAKGIKAFKKGMTEEDASSAPPHPSTISEPRALDHQDTGKVAPGSELPSEKKPSAF